MTHSADAAMVRFTFSISPDDPSLDGHFPGNPIVPGVVLLDQVHEAIGRSLPKARLHRWHMVKFVNPLLPGETASVEIVATAASSVHFHCATSDGRVLATGSAEIANETFP